MGDRKNTREFQTGSNIPVKEVYLPEDVAGLNYKKDPQAPGFMGGKSLAPIKSDRAATGPEYFIDYYVSQLPGLSDAASDEGRSDN